MQLRRIIAAGLLLTSIAATPAFGQSAAIEGRALDQQEAAIPGVVVTLRERDTGLTRETISDGKGTYRMTGVPPGRYDIRATLNGFITIEQRDTIVDVAAIVRVDFPMRVARVAETVDVAARSPLLQVSSPTIGGVVDERRIQELPLNGRQFANLAGTLPGVGIGFHRDPTKSSEYVPQVGGGNGRNVNYVVDGADNTDDTVGGPMQLYPLDAIDEFRFSIASYGADHGRASGGVLSVITKSGTNQMAGTGFVFGRHEALNAKTTSERRAMVEKPDYRRWQFGGSVGGPVVSNTAHFFAAVERVQQDTFQAVDTQGLSPAFDGVAPVRYRENLLTGKMTITASPGDRVMVRYAANANSQPQGVGPLVAAEAWGDSRNRFHSLNGSFGRVVGTSAFNELIVQYATFDNTVEARTTRPTETFPNSVVIGHALQAPQATQQRQWQLRDDLSVHVGGRFGVAHELKVGGSFTHEPKLGAPPANLPPGYLSYTHLSNDRNGPVTQVAGNADTAPIEFPGYNIPMKRVGAYLQDDWRATSRLTINAGVRYDLALGYQPDQSLNPNFAVLQQAASLGRFTNVIGFQDFGETPRNDRNNIQPRLGFAFDLDGTGSDVVRGGWGLFSDSVYTNNNILFAAVDALGSFPSRQFFASNPNGIRKPDGTLFRVGDSIASIAGLNEGGTTGLNGEVISPRFEQPFMRQASFGWSHQLGRVSLFSADYLHSNGRSLSTRMRLNSRPNGGPRRFADLQLDPNSISFRAVTSDGRSRYDALILSFRRRTVVGLDLAASYTWSKATSLFGQAVDETGLGANTILDVTNPFAPVEWGPAAADARHRVTLSAIAPLGTGVQLAPILYFRSALPVNTIEGIDRNGDFTNNDLPDRAFAFDGIDRPAKDTGGCNTINCGLGARLVLVNLRVSKTFTPGANSNIDLIAEIFNLFNATNPNGFNARRMLSVVARNPDFMQPTSFAGDFQQPEQRLGQIGVKWRFGK